jgi:hypothetical protein
MTPSPTPANRQWAGAIVGLMVVIGAGLVGYLVWTGRVAGGKPFCDICNRELRPGAGFITVAANGAKHVACCPRCGLRSILNRGDHALEATDFAAGKRIPAARALYLEGSDIMECCETMGFRTDEGKYGEMQYDRCMPSLIAFSKREDAERVRREHGGKIITFAEAEQSVARQLGR